MIEFGPYAAYVWPAYALTGLVMAGLVAVSVGRLKRRRKDLEAHERAAGPRRPRGGDDDEDE